MSTRSTISIKNQDGTFTGIYCHFDGYPSGNGAILLEHYNDESKIRELLSLGDISCLEQEVNPTSSHSYENPQFGVTVAYGRDRGEQGTDAVTTSEWKPSQEYNYLYENGKWYVDGEELTQELIDDD